MRSIIFLVFLCGCIDVPTREEIREDCREIAEAAAAAAINECTQYYEDQIVPAIAVALEQCRAGDNP